MIRIGGGLKMNIDREDLCRETFFGPVAVTVRQHLLYRTNNLTKFLLLKKQYIDGYFFQVIFLYELAYLQKHISDA